MMVKDKGRDIAILRTMGASRGMVLRIFILSGASIGVVGTLAGLALGVAFTRNIEAIRQFVQNIVGVDLFSAEIYFFTEFRRASTGMKSPWSSQWRWHCRSSPRFIRPGAPHGSIRSKRCATSDCG